jgi:hypothetical protein
MNYFTRERYLAQQLSDAAAMDAADAAWEQAVARYDAYLQTIRPDLPECTRQLLDGFDRHDARVLSMGQRGDTFLISMQLDVPPNELLTITYTLAGPPEMKTEKFPGGEGSAPPRWLYDEIELVQQGDRKHCIHSIVFSNGWETHIPFRDVQMATAIPMFPHPRSGGHLAEPASASGIA